jgi:WD40-like Beta Propeller Repeat
MKLRSRILFLFALVGLGVMVARGDVGDAQVAAGGRLTGTLLWHNIFIGEGGNFDTYTEVNLVTGAIHMVAENRAENYGALPSFARNTNGDTVRLEGDGTLVITGLNGENPSRIAPTRVKDLRGQLDTATRSEMAISSDGGKVAFIASNRDGSWVVVRARNGDSITAFYSPLFSKMNVLTDDPRCVYAAPTWTPDGRLIVTAFGEGMGGPYPDPGICGSVFQITDRKLEKLSPIWQNINDMTSPTVSPDGRQVAFIGGDKSLWIANFDGGGKRRVTKPDPNFDPLVNFTSLVWSPDGRALAGVVNEVMVVIPLETGRLQVLRNRDGKLLSDLTGEHRVIAWSR